MGRGERRPHGRREKRKLGHTHTHNTQCTPTNPFLPTPGCVLDSLGFNSMAHTHHTPTTYNSVSRHCPSVSRSVRVSLSVRLSFRPSVCLVFVYLCVSVCVCSRDKSVLYVCVLRASYLPCICSRCALLGGCGFACCLLGIAACCLLFVGVLMLVSDRDETEREE